MQSGQALLLKFKQTFHLTEHNIWRLLAVFQEQSQAFKTETETVDSLWVIVL